MNKLLSRLRSAVDKYHMIREGDKIAVGVSGGKDSVVLLCALAQLKKFYPEKFELCAVTIDPQFHNTPYDYSEIRELCHRLGVDYHIRRTELYEIIFNVRKETNPCSLCARMRRGILHDLTKEYGCNKIALGHHMDDAAETFLMNLLNGGRAGSFSPVSYLSRKDIYMIRPLVFIRESEVEKVARKLNLPVVKSKCPVDGKTERENTKDLIRLLSKEHKKVTEKIITAMQKGHISDW